MALERHVYFFGNGRADGSAAMRDILGGKGAGLAEMANLGIPVPPGFTISAKLCIDYVEHGTFPPALRAEVDRHLKHLERVTKKGFGDPKNPLLVSVRSGAAISMPGMMETILNLGLNEETTQALARATRNEQFARNSYERLEQMEKDVGGTEAPATPEEQLWGAIEAVFKSWHTERAVAYRKLNGISDDLGTAVSVCAMVFGNMGDDSGTGVAFTRNPNTGEK